MTPLKIATTFSGGFGSVEMAFKYLNIPHEVVFACEWMDPQRKSYLQNHSEPTSNFYKDIRDLDGTKYKDEVFYLHESPPCQSYSMAGSRGGASDERGGLMFEAIKKIDEIQPKMFSVENVKGLLSSNNGEDWKNILKDFNSLKGYTISWGIMNAKEQGTPQNRERVFIVGFRGQAPKMSFPQRIKLNKRLGDFLEEEVDEKYFLNQKTIDGFVKHKERHDGRGNGFGFKIKNTDDIASAISTKAGTRQTDNYITEKIKIISGHKSGFVEVGYGDSINLAFAKNPNSRSTARNDGCINTLDTSCNQAVVLERIRKFTPKECARLQGDFDDMFKLEGFKDSKLYEFIGNAMDISTTKNLITKMLSHQKIVKFTEPSEPSFEVRAMKQTQGSLF